MSTHLHLVFSVAGYVGATLVLYSYAATSTGRLSTASRRYQLLNLAGGGALLGNCVALAAWPLAGVNLVWMSISVLSLIQAATARAGRARMLDLGPDLDEEIAEQLRLCRSTGAPTGLSRRAPGTPARS